MNQTHEITSLLKAWSDGSQKALDELLPTIYAELHRQASRHLRRERRDHTFQTTDLINEAYLKLINQQGIKWDSRTHFFAISARLMRQILIDHARSKKRQKRGGNSLNLPLNEEALVFGNGENLDLLALDEVLHRLAEIDERQVRVVELKFFSGLTLEETAVALDISRTTVAQDWKIAKAWIHRELTR
jgi:RNA polymerase sigma factor (TIGR02999 family)